MITRIFSSNLETKNYSPKKSNHGNTISKPLQNNPTSLNYPLKHFYKPVISFRGDTPEPPTTPTKIPEGYVEVKTSVEEVKEQLLSSVPHDSNCNLQSIPAESRFKGPFYTSESDNLAILLKSDKAAILVLEPGLEPEIFLHKFAERVGESKYQKLGFAEDTDVFCIKDPMVFSKSHLKIDAIQHATNEQIMGIFGPDGKIGVFEVDIRKAEHDANPFLRGLDKLNQYNGDRPKIVFVKGFEKILSIMGEHFNKKTFLENLTYRYPNLSIVGILDKNDLKLPKVETFATQTDLIHTRNLQRGLKGIPQLPLSGLSVPQTEEFFKKNAFTLLYSLAKYEPNYVGVSNPAMRKIIPLAAKDTDMALPGSALRLLDRIAASKLQFSKVPNQKGFWVVNSADVEKYKDNHKELLNISKNPDVKIDVIENVSTTMDDIVGLHAAKNAVEDVFEYAKNPKAFVKSGREVPSGYLLAGGGGIGKTELAIAVAGEIKKRFNKEIPVFRMSNFGTEYINTGANAVNNSYEDARAHMRRIGAETGIMIIDEADKIGKKIGRRNGHDEDEKTTNALKDQIGGIPAKTTKEKIITIAISNHPEVFDTELLRPGRLRQINCEGLSTKQDIEKLLHLKSKTKPFESEAEKTKLLSTLADYVRGLNGDQMTKILDESTRLALKTEKKVITQKEITDGFTNILFGEKSVSDYSPKERLVACLHEALHAEAATFSKAKTLIAISNESRGTAAAYTLAAKKYKMFISFEDAIDDVSMNDAGGYGETLLNKNHGSGVSGDYRKKTNTIDTAIKKYGLGVYTPQISFFDEEGHENIELSKQYATEIKKDYELFSETSDRIIKQILKAHKDWLLNGYLEENRAAILAGKDGKNYLGQEYIDLRTKWLEKTGVIKAEPVLENGLDAFKQIAHTDKFWTEHAGLNNARNIMSDGVETIIGLSQQRSWLDDSTKTAEGLNKHIGKIVELAENGSTWLTDVISKTGKGSAEEALVKTVNTIVNAAKGIEPKEAKGLMARIIKRVR